MAVSLTIDSLRLIGGSNLMQQLYKMIGRICNADCAVLLIGEKGSGRSLVAAALHYFSHRASSPFLCLDGSQTREANDEEVLGIDETHPTEGTLYVTDYTSLPSFVQHQLVTIHRRREYKCIHTGQPRKHNLRFVVSTSGSIKEELESGKMPMDLFYDWNFLPLYVPPLRDRKEDIPLLANYFLEVFSSEMRISRKELSPEAVEILLARDWPGNVTELKNAIKTAVMNCRGNYIRAEHLPEPKRSGGSEALTRLEMFLNSKLSSYIENAPLSMHGNLYQLLLPQMEKSLLRYAMKRCHGNKNKAAKWLGLHRNTLNKKLQNLA
jgi:two-component system nitrogen regulation response regulator GlnG